MMSRTIYRCNTLFRHIKNVSLLSSSRMLSEKKYDLYTDETLGIKRFNHVKKLYENKFGHDKGAFMTAFGKLLKEENPEIQRDDFISLIYLTETDEDLNTVKKTLPKFIKHQEFVVSDPEELKFAFGPLVMRLAKKFNDLSFVFLVKDPQNKNFFKQANTMTVALDMLLENEKYQEIIDLYEYIQINYSWDGKFPQSLIPIYAAACYQLNTLEAMNKCLKIFRFQDVGNFPPVSRGLAFLMALAIKQNRPKIACELLERNKRTILETLLFRSTLQIKALSDREMFSDILRIMAFHIRGRNPLRKEPIYSSEILEETEQKFEKSANKRNIDAFKDLRRQSEESGMVDSRTLEQHLRAPIELASFQKKVKPEKIPEFLLSQQSI